MQIFVFLISILLAQQAFAATPTLAVEKAIAYQQGQFAALYEQCGSKEEKLVIGGSVATWRAETFAGYQGSAAERQALDHAFNQALAEVQADPQACKSWVKQVAAAWRSIIRLSVYGTPVAFNPETSQP